MGTATKSISKKGKSGDARELCTATGNELVLRTVSLPDIRMPYVTRLSFVPLLRYWKGLINSESSVERLLAREIKERVASIPEFHQPIDDYAFLDEYQDLVDLLMAGLFPVGLRDTQLAKASKPFDLNAFYFTPAMCNLMQGCEVRVRMEQQTDKLLNNMITKVGATILNAHYGQNLDVDPLVIFTIEPDNSGIMFHYKSLLNLEYCEVVPTRPLKKLSQARINKLLANVYDLDAWMEALPPENFEIHGVAGMDLIDITKEESISRMRLRLMEKDAVVKPGNIGNLESLLRTYFSLPELRLGVMAIDYPVETTNEFRYKIRHCILSDMENCMLDPANSNSAYEKACRYKEVVMIEDLHAVKYKSGLEKRLIENGFASYIVAPLISKSGKIIGMIELASPRPYELNSLTEQDFRNIIPLFNMAVERSREETDNQIEAIIREQFTAIHPSVEWRFVEAAFDYMDKEETEGRKAVVDTIAFNEVYPLYAQADIVNSSNTRNRAIQEDFLKNLELLRDLLKTTKEQVDFPIVDQYLFETEEHIADLSEVLRSSDESMIIDFIVGEVHPVLKELSQREPAIALAYSLYRSQLDPQFGVVYRKRKEYEESVTRINRTISDYLEKEDERSQQMLPHYFEKYKTDGVQFELYVGQSILRRGKFSNMHLRNLRLWQLEVICNITRQMERLKSELPMPLSTAQLIFVYGQPISIRFRTDDKRFDVDGAYNIRYEIIKKRIDKATVTLADGSKERLTQAGKIAIVYASVKDREEYLHYLDYLQRKGMIEKDIEEIELDKLQGVQGLKALRVGVVNE